MIEPGLDKKAEAPARILAIRRKSFWRPVLRPSQRRRLPKSLQPEAVYDRAGQLTEGLLGRAYANLVRKIDQSPFHLDTQATAYFNGHEAFEAMLAAIREAAEEVLVEAYVLKDDQTGRDFLNALVAAAQRGVAVKVLADAFGSSATRRDFWRLLKQGGSRIRLFRRPRYAPLSLMPVLDHRKLIIVDRKIAFTGGMNIADEYRDGRPDMPAWRDTHIALCGGVVWEMVTIYAESWLAAGGDPIHCEDMNPVASAGVPTLVLDSRPGRGQNEVFSAYAATMGAARKTLWMTNAYFAPGRRMVRFLKATAARGVDVRLMLPGRSDIPVVRTATQSYYKELLTAGIRIFEYQSSVLHAKTLVADGQVSVIGSTNFDFRSFNFNAECNVLMQDAAMSKQLEGAFEQDMQQANEITLADWLKQPWWRHLKAWLARRLVFLL